MLRDLKLAAVLFAILAGAACHRNALPAAPATPSAQAPAATTPSTAPAPTPAVTTPPPTTAPATTTPANTTPAVAEPPPTTGESGTNPQTQPKRPARPSTPPQATPPAPQYRLGQALTPEEQRTNHALVDQHIQHANQALASIGNRPLTQQQKSLIPQIRGFIAQANQLRKTDPVAAKNLAEKADVLASDLVATFK